MAVIVFWTTVALIFYAYGGYALLISLLSLVVRNPIRIDEKYEPTVTILITAYNEEKAIAKKLNNTLDLDYPHDRLEILVASDGSTDRTDQIVLDYGKRNKIVRLIRVEGRVGKTETQNQAVSAANGEIVIFSDATTDYKIDAIRKIVRNYGDSTVGAVSGRYNYITEKGSAMGMATVLFWKYENFIKSCQTQIKTITGCCGCIYSVRKALYVPLRRDVTSDLVEPLKIFEKGYRIAFEPQAIAYETTTEHSSEELKMRIRVITQGMNGLLHMKQLLNPVRHGFVGVQLLSHKVLRWLIPVLMIILLLSNWFLLGYWFYDLVFYLQMGIYGLAAAGWWLDRYGVKAKLTSLPLYFCVINIACLISLFNVIKGEKMSIWEPDRNA